MLSGSGWQRREHVEDVSDIITLKSIVNKNKDGKRSCVWTEKAGWSARQIRRHATSGCDATLEVRVYTRRENDAQSHPCQEVDPQN